jgi:hypothetical protein
VPLDHSNPKVVREIEKANDAYASEDGTVLTNLMKTMAGRAFVWRKLGPLLFETPFRENPYVMAYNVGIQRQGIFLFGEISKYCPEQFALMMREAHERDAAIKSAAERAGRSNGDRGVDEPIQLDLYSGPNAISVDFESTPDEAA